MINTCPFCQSPIEYLGEADGYDKFRCLDCGVIFYRPCDWRRV